MTKSHESQLSVVCLSQGLFCTFYSFLHPEIVHGMINKIVFRVLRVILYSDIYYILELMFRLIQLDD